LGPVLGELPILQAAIRLEHGRLERLDRIDQGGRELGMARTPAALGGEPCDLWDVLDNQRRQRDGQLPQPLR